MTAVDIRSDASSNPRPPAPGRLTFNRPPRIRPSLSQTKFEIPAQPAALQKPSTSFAGGLLIPLIAVAAMGSLYLFGGFGGGGGSMNVVLLLVVLAASSALPTGWVFFEDRRRFRRRVREQISDHGRRLRNAELELQRLRDEEQSLRAAQDPAPDDLVRRALARGRRLFERRVSDQDYLQPRLGTGLAPTQIEIIYSSDRAPETNDVPAELLRLQAEGRNIADQYRQVPDVPIRFDLRQAGAVGLAGPYSRTAPLARSVLAQLAVHHSPDDLRIAAYLGSRPLEDWAWLKWLPHIRGGGGDAASALAWDDLTRQALSRWLLDELTGRKRALEESSSGAVTFPWVVLFVDDFRALQNDTALRMALADGPRLHVAMLGLADDVSLVPGACGGVAAVEDRGGEGQLTYGQTSGLDEPVQLVPDAMTVEAAERLARALAPLVVLDEGAEGDALDIPARITFFESIGVANIEQVDVRQSWEIGSSSNLLRTPLGAAAGGELLWLDLKEQSQGGQGPHGLVAGTTGAGKSELLLTFIAGLALRHSPEVLNFVLVDYKGGDAFQAVADLPHTIALITDLDRHLAARALLTLRSEIKRREHRLLEMRAAGVTSLTEYQSRRGDSAPMPFLVIVVDEFARLKDDLPEFISGLIDVARVGRSLGVHLILATQTPSGTVDDQIQKNSNFGISLRVRDAMDSKQIIGETDAALLPGSLPGRGYFRAGLEPVHLFQTARVGAPYQARASYATFDVVPFEPRLQPTLKSPRANGTASAAEGTEVRALVKHLRAAAQALDVVAPPWPAPLSDVVSLVQTEFASDPEMAPPGLLPVLDPWTWSTPPQGDWLVAPVGLVDEPTRQAQGPFFLDVSRNCLVYGGAGSGKSTLLRTLASSLALSHSPRDLHLYCLDFDSRTLSVLAGLPHCGEDGIFFPRDTVRIRRLIRLLEHELQQRREAGVTNLRQQRRAGSDPKLEAFPFIVVLLDNFAAFRETFEEEENVTRSLESMVGDLGSLMRDGPAAGITFVLTASAGQSIASSIVNSVENRVALRLTDAADYSIVGRIENVPEHVPPGRGFAVGTPPREFQVALLPDEVEAATQLAAVSTTTAELFGRLRAAASNVRPQAVQDLPTWLNLADPRLAVASPSPLAVVLGLDDERSRPVVVNLAELQHLIVLGPPGSGKTSLTASVVLQCTRSDGPGVYLVLPRPSALGELVDSPACRGVARNPLQLGELVDELEVVVDERRESLRTEADAPLAPLLLVMDDYELLRQDDDFYDLESRLTRLARRGTTVGLHLVVTGSNIELRDGRSELIRYISQLRVGVLLQPDVEYDGDVFSVRLRRMVETPPVGRGYLVVRQLQQLFQAATPQFEGQTLSASIQQLR